MADDVDPDVFPKSVVIAVSHHFHESGFVVRREMQRRGTRPKGKRQDILAIVFRSFGQSVLSTLIARIVGNIGVVAHRISNAKDPGKKAKFESSVMANSVEARIRRCHEWDHRFQSRRMGKRESELRAAVIGTAERSDTAIAPALRGDPRRRVESIVRVISEETPSPFRTVAAADTLNDDDITAWNKSGGDVFFIASAVVRSANKDRWKFFVRWNALQARPVDVGYQLGAIAHGNKLVLEREECVFGRRLREDWPHWRE